MGGPTKEGEKVQKKERREKGEERSIEIRETRGGGGE